MKIRDRIKELRRVRAGDLRPHPMNWRTHPQAQRDALCGVLAEIGYADALLARELPDGSLQLIDGHLRAETTPEAEVPVLVLDLDDAEARKLLALLDPLAGMADADQETLAELLADVDTENQAIRAMLDRMLRDPEGALEGASAPPSEDAEGASGPREVPVPESFQVVVECADEAQQRAVYERMAAEGFQCRLLTL
ncbi:MAG: ParB N-terminal domain-containing protein [Thermoguttaceae bacterium]|jgi:ParB-like chromosome segregation protein Spo0J